MKRAKLAALLATLLFAASGAYASTIYHYVGNPFTDQTGALAGSFDRITISLTFDQPIAPSDMYMLSAQAPQLINWHVSDGLFDFGPAFAGSLGTCMIQTDASGGIVWWLLDAELTAPDGTLYQDISTVAADGAGIYYSSDLNSNATVIGSPGAWTQAGRVPEPGSFSLMLSALLATTAFALRQTRK